MTRRSELLVGGLLVLVGVLWLLDVAGVVDAWRWGVVGPLLLVAFGLWQVVTAFGGTEADVVGGRVDVLAALGDRHLRCDGPFEGGSVVTLLGDVELDLTGATLGDSPVELSATVVLGDLDLLVPADWRVRTVGPTLLSDVKVRRGAVHPDVVDPSRARGRAPARDPSWSSGPSACSATSPSASHPPFCDARAWA